MKRRAHRHPAVDAPMESLLTYRALPLEAGMDATDPFILLNHHGPQQFLPNNAGLPFGPHPHRGFETVTFIVSGDLVHEDNQGHRSRITAGGIQWMTAGKGIVHSEVSSDEFLAEGGKLEVLQLWMNLPAKFKRAEPRYTGLQKDGIPRLSLDQGRATLNLMAGNYADRKGPVKALTDVFLGSLEFKSGGVWETKIPSSRNIFFYLVHGKMEVHGQNLQSRDFCFFENDGDEVSLRATEDSLVLFGHAEPYGEPILAYGPFVMNTEREIEEAYADYRAGRNFS